MAFAYQLASATVLLLAAVSCNHQGGGGYHYNSFQGPVSGAIRQVQVPVAAATHNQHHQHNPHQQQSAPHNPHAQEASVDYVAKPDYAFAYGVEDPHTGQMQNHKESRDGDTVRGQYNVLQPDGSMRTVTYTADSKNGFQATVHNTAATIPQQQYATPVDGHGNPIYDADKPNYSQNAAYRNYNNGAQRGGQHDGYNGQNKYQNVDDGQYHEDRNGY